MDPSDLGAPEPFALSSQRLGALPIVNYFLDRRSVSPALLERYIPGDDQRLLLSPASAVRLVVASLLLGRNHRVQGPRKAGTRSLRSWRRTAAVLCTEGQLRSAPSRLVRNCDSYSAVSSGFDAAPVSLLPRVSRLDAWRLTARL